MVEDSLSFHEIDADAESTQVASFLATHVWPFHSKSRLSLDAARNVALGPMEDVRAFWIKQNRNKVGLIRLLDLKDVEDGSVQFDIRLAKESRGHGIGRAAVLWLTIKLFSDYPSLHRIEATTRIDNQAMRRALESNGYQLEGRLRETWPTDDGIRFDTALYGRLRSDA
jgi:RimJ/RimL family protein N-acetyltransferase